METRYPIRKADGQEYANQDELMTALGKMAGGRWLIGANRMWHSGIHVNGEVAPASVLNATTPDRAVPLQCMAGGQIVAWRINRHYRTAEYTLGNPLCYSSTFVLVRSTHRPDPADESTWLAFHSLYMHLAPVSDYPIARCYQVTKQGNGIPCRRYSGNETTGQSAPVSSALPPCRPVNASWLCDKKPF